MTETTFVRPAPAQTVETKPFWEAANRGQLLFGHCNTCGERHYYPRRLCPYCLSGKVEWLPASGEGIIHSYSVVHNKQFPYVLAYVTLVEGVSVFTNIVDFDPARLAVGAPVRLAFDATSSGQMVPLFRDAAQSIQQMPR
jgi:uncharacterized protein